MRISPKLEIPDDEIQLAFVRASGPGGQNVNKVATAVQLRFDAASSPSLGADLRERLLALAGQRATEDGVILIEAKNSRSQHRNREAALERFRELVRQAEKPSRKRRTTLPSLAAKERRLQRKRRRSQKKAERRWTPQDE